MRIRTIKPDFWEHPIMGKQTDTTKLLAIGLLNVADDDGYFYADPKLIRNAIRPFDDDSGITTVSLRELSEIGYISIRKHPTHGDIGKVVSFASHQVINKPKRSKLRQLHDSGIDTVAIRDEYRQEGNGKERNGGGMEPPQTPLDFQESKPEKHNPNRMATFEEVQKWARNQMPPVSDDCTEAFFDRMEADGWINAQGFPLADWRARFRSWIKAWYDNAANPNRKAR